MPRELSSAIKAMNTIMRPELDLRSRDENSMRPTGQSDLFRWVQWYISQEVLGTGKSEHTIAAVHQDLQKFVNFFYKRVPAGHYSAWTRQLSQAFIDAMRRADYSINSMRRTISYVSALANYLESLGMVNYESHPMRGLKPIKPAKDSDAEAPKSLRILAEDGRVIEEGRVVYDRMKNAAVALTLASNRATNALPYRNLAILTTLYFTGLRAHEICGLTLDTMEYSESGGIWFSGFKRKGDPNKTGSVFLHPNGVQFLEEYILHERNEIARNNRAAGRQLFLRFRGARMTRADIWDIIKDLAEAALPSEMRALRYRIAAHPHSLRHEITYALLKEGVNETETARHLGHASTRYISRYSKRSRKTAEQLISGIPLK